MPYRPDKPQYRASTDKPETFSKFGLAKKIYEKGGFDGIGILINGGIAGIDIDHCVDDAGELSQMAKDIVDSMDAYTEISPSGHGIRILFFARGFSYDKEKYYIKNSKNGLEIYVAGMTNRFLTITGNAIRQRDIEERADRLQAILDKYMKRSTTEQTQTKPHIMPADLSDLELIDKAGQAKNGDIFRALWSGTWEGIYNSQSEADQALCNILAFWTGCEAGRMDSLFRQSGLMRDKWDRRQSGTTYGDITIRKAINGCREVYNPIVSVEAPQKPTAMSNPQDCVKRLFHYDITKNKDGVEKRKLIQSVKNWEIAMENDQRLAKKIRYNSFLFQIMLCGSVPWENEQNMRAWTDSDDANLFSLIQADYCLNNRKDCMDAVSIVANRNQFNPVRDMLDSLSWDGKEHIKNLLPDFLGVEDTDYNHAVFKLWMLGAVARIYHPGVPFDYMIIIQGRQGLGKSKFFSALALDDSWFSDSIGGLDDKDATEGLLGIWIVEFGELRSLANTRAGIDGVKRFITASQDKIRLPYARRKDTFYRQCVFVGTTNEETYLTDETGNRRFLIIRAGVNDPQKSIFADEAMDEIRQAWAQAVYVWKNDLGQNTKSLVLDEKYLKEAEQMQAGAMVDDGMEGLLLDFIKDKTETCPLEIWQECLGESGRPPRNISTRINAFLSRQQDWEKLQTPTKIGKYANQRGWRKKWLPVPDDAETPFS